jgi:2-oxoisovalerate dehydrogenase E1 component beta subunit
LGVAIETAGRADVHAVRGLAVDLDAVGAAVLRGLRPVVEMQFDAFAYPALEQIASHVAKMRNRTRGSLSIPMVIRVPYGGGIGGVEHHSDSSEGLFAQVPGLEIATPATVTDAYSLLREAIEHPDPVVFFEPKRLYWTTADVDLPVTTEPFGKAAVRRSGSDVTLISYGPCVDVALGAASAAADEYGLSVEVLDLRTLVPLDESSVIDSVARTSRCVVISEAPGFGGVAAEIAALVQNRCFYVLAAPIHRVTGLDMPYPPPMYEHHYLPSVDRVLDAIANLEWDEPLTDVA